MTANKKRFTGTHGFTATDNRLFYLQERLTPNAFCLLIRIYRMTEGYDSKPKALANAYFQKTCNMSKNTVTKAIKELDDLGLIHTKRRPRESTLYSINLEQMNSIFQEIQDSIKSDSINNESQDMGIIEGGANDESHILTHCFPYSDLHESQNMSANKENTKENVIKENTLDRNDKNDKINFEVCWNAYDKKNGKAKCENKWAGLSAGNREKVMAHVSDYVPSTPDKKYRKNPLTYLNNEGWHDEVIQRQSQQNNNNQVNSYAAQKPKKLTYHSR